MIALLLAAIGCRAVLDDTSPLGPRYAGVGAVAAAAPHQSQALRIVTFNVEWGKYVDGVLLEYSKEFFAAPGIAVQLSAGRIGIIPEVQYYFTGHSELTWPVHNKGLAVSARLVFLSEIRRIRR